MNFKEFLLEKAKNPEPFLDNLEASTINNNKFRNILFTGTIQLVTMTLSPKEEIGLESHDTDQFFFFYGPGKLVINGTDTGFNKGTGLVVPANTKHNIINTGDTELKLFSIYGKPEH